YRGSTGFGREYRRLLNGRWGEIDWQDCVAAARHLAAAGEADPDRTWVEGGSAGGYVVFCSLVFDPQAFAAGVSYFGVADVEALARSDALVHRSGVRVRTGRRARAARAHACALKSGVSVGASTPPCRSIVAATTDPFGTIASSVSIVAASPPRKSPARFASPPGGITHAS